VSNLAELQQRLGHKFRDEALLRLALTHPSVAHDSKALVPHNQRLEFLGDAVLSITLSKALYEKFPEADEGRLTKSRAKLANAASLAVHGRALGLGAHLILSTGEERTGGRDRNSALTDAFEAVLGAIYLDGGLEAARQLVLREFTADLESLAVPDAIENPKGDLQEVLQAASAVAPVYETISAEGPDHDRSFTCAVRHNGVELARGSGKSKRLAESDAALNALKQIRDQSNQAK
jgi:ribonuclease-3